MVGKPARSISDKVKLSQMRALLSVAQTGSFSEAALRLNVSQSTVSHSIAALEEALGVELIHRGRQKASLTPVGSKVFEQAQQILSLVDGMGQVATQARGIEGGLVRIAAFRSLASEILPGAIAHLHQHHPTVQVAIIEFEDTQSLVNALVEGQADLGMADLIEGAEFETFKIMDDPFIALVPPNSVDIGEQLTWNDLRNYPLITSSSDCCKLIRAHLRSAQPPVSVDYLIANDSTAVSMTRQGLGISLMPKLAAQPIPSEVRTAQLPFDMARPLGVSCLRNTLLTPATYAFLDTFKSLYSPGCQQSGGAQRYGVERTHAKAQGEKPGLDKKIGDEKTGDEKAAISATRHH